MVKRSIDENLIRSTKAPTINAGVIIANVIWNEAKTVSGISPDIESTLIPIKSDLLKPPQYKESEGPKAML